MRVLLLLALSACATQHLPAPGGRGDGAREVSDSELVFAADWSEAATGPLVAGTAVHVDYDPARLPTCRGSKYGQPAWGLTAHYRIDGGAVRTTAVGGPSGAEALLELERPGELELWFSNTDVWGCVAWDSDFGANYRFNVVEPPAVTPEWLGNGRWVISRQTCDGTFCDHELRALDEGFVYDTWARQRASVASVTFQAWAPGVTDWSNPDLWQQLDARIHVATEPSGAEVDWDYVDLHGFVGNDARYAYPLRRLDPLGGHTLTDPEDCPAVDLRVGDDGVYVEADAWFWFSVNGVELRPEEGGAWKGTFVDHVGLYEPCLP